MVCELFQIHHINHMELETQDIECLCTSECRRQEQHKPRFLFICAFETSASKKNLKI